MSDDQIEKKEIKSLSCVYEECGFMFTTADTHYYNEETDVCYCSEGCYEAEAEAKKDNELVTMMGSVSLEPKKIEENKQPCDYELIDVDSITEIPNEYPEEFNEFCLTNQLTPPKITSGNGKALLVMLKYKYCYWNRDTCDKFIKKFGISTRDSIQLFNKHNQWGIQTNSGNERGRLYIVYPYCLSNKHKMRKNFKFNGTEEEKNNEIDKIKSTIKIDYIDVQNSLWQLGHKNPGSTDNSTDNLVLQPPIQGKYRDNYIFIDTLTKIPMPNKLQNMIEKKEIEFTQEQIISYKQIFDKLFTSI